MPGTTNPHDAFFKAIFHSPDAAGAALRRILPRELSDAVDWSGLSLLSGEYVDGALGGSRGDLVFEAPLGGTTAVICFLMEHQSRPEHWMVLRALGYALQFWQRRRRMSPEQRGLPLVLPVVLYNGARPWSAPTALEELLDLPDALAEVLSDHVPRFRLVLDDLSRADDADIEDSTRFALATLGLLLLKNAPHAGDWAPMLDRLTPHLLAVARRADGVEVLQQALVYSYRVSDLPPGAIESRLVGRVPPDVEESIMTTAERLHAEGREEGLEAGREAGLEAGHLERTRLILAQLLSLKLGPLPAHVQSALQRGTQAELDAWMDHFMVADSITLADVDAHIRPAD